MLEEMEREREECRRKKKGGKEQEYIRDMERGESRSRTRGRTTKGTGKKQRELIAASIEVEVARRA